VGPGLDCEKFQLMSVSQNTINYTLTMPVYHYCRCQRGLAAYQCRSMSNVAVFVETMCWRPTWCSTSSRQLCLTARSNTSTISLWRWSSSAVRRVLSSSRLSTCLDRIPLERC